MNRLAQIREYVDKILAGLSNVNEKRDGYMHLYGVSQLCTLIALKRKENAELAAVAGMLHDIHAFAYFDPEDHAHKSAVMAREIMLAQKNFTDAEIDLVCDAIFNHSDKASTYSPFTEVLIDADVMQHCLYNPLFQVEDRFRARYEALLKEFKI